MLLFDLLSLRDGSSDHKQSHQPPCCIAVDLSQTESTVYKDAQLRLDLVSIFKYALNLGQQGTHYQSWIISIWL